MSERYDGFTVSLFQDDADDWVAHFNELPEISAFGPSPETACEAEGATCGLVEAVHGEQECQFPGTQEGSIRASTPARVASSLPARWRARQLGKQL